MEQLIDLSKYDFNIQEKGYPKNIYAIRVLDIDKDKFYDIAINHDGYCPSLSDERDESRYNDYLSNLEYKVIDEFFKKSKIRKPKYYTSLLEIMTNEQGELYHHARCSKL